MPNPTEVKIRKKEILYLLEFIPGKSHVGIVSDKIQVQILFCNNFDALFFAENIFWNFRRGDHIEHEKATNNNIVDENYFIEAMEMYR